MLWAMVSLFLYFNVDVLNYIDNKVVIYVTYCVIGNVICQYINLYSKVGRNPAWFGEFEVFPVLCCVMMKWSVLICLLQWVNVDCHRQTWLHGTMWKNGPPSFKSEPGDLQYANDLLIICRLFTLLIYISGITHSKHYPLLLTVFESPFIGISYHCLYKPIHILELVLKPVY